MLRPHTIVLSLVTAALALLPLLPTAVCAAPVQDGNPTTGTITDSGYCSNPQSDAAGAVWEGTYELPPGTITTVEVILAWSDDEGSRSRPDTLSVKASDAGGASRDESGSAGSLLVAFPQGTYNGTWTVRVECLEAGSTPVGPIGLISRTDPGNSWSFVLEYVYVPAPGDGGAQGPPANIQAVLASPIFKLHVVLMVSSTVGFLVVGCLAGTYLVARSRWSASPSALLRTLATPRPYRSLAPHVWLAFFIASVPIGMWVAGKVYGWENSWTSLPVVWNPGFYDITNADHSSLLVMTLWALPMWLNRGDALSRRPHVRWLGWSSWLRRLAARAPKPRFTDREMALIYFFLGVIVFLLFMVQPHGN